jgi:nicotinate-nucleotide adenylyltransferase
MDNIGIFGGTFNPVHKGHEVTALNFFFFFELDKLIIIPSNIPPHKQINVKITAVQRFEMCAACFDKYKDYNIRVSDSEIKKDGVSYTFNTLTEIKKEYNSDKIYFLIGSDMFLYFEHWHRYQELLKLCVFVVAFRNERDKQEVLEFREKFIKMGADIKLLENEPFEISSTELRKQIKNNNSDLSKYISAEVLAYIRERNIYVLQ